MEPNPAGGSVGDARTPLSKESAMKTIIGTAAMFCLLLALCGDSKPEEPGSKVGPDNTVS